MTERHLNGTDDPAMLRCFVAMFLDAASARQLERMVAGVLPEGSRSKGTGRVPVRNYHVTLKFLGDTPAGALAGILARVRALDGHPVTADVTGLAGFPASTRSRVLVATLAAQPLLDAWHGELERQLGADGRGFRPHVTVARLKRPRVFHPVLLDHDLPVRLGPPQLYRSDPSSGGVRYRPVTG